MRVNLEFRITGTSFCVSRRVEVFSYGGNQLLSRQVEALTGIRVRNTSAGITHSLVVTEEGT